MPQETLRDTVPDIVLPFPEGGKTVMLVEEEPRLRSELYRFLHSYGFFMLQAASASEAVVLADVFFYPIHLLIADLSTPRVNGYALADHMASGHPETETLFLCDFASEAFTHRPATEKKFAFLQKPARPDALLLKVIEILYPQAKSHGGLQSPHIRGNPPDKDEVSASVGMHGCTGPHRNAMHDMH